MNNSGRRRRNPPLKDRLTVPAGGGGGIKLKEWRELGRVPVRAFADLVPCSERTVYRWENGGTQPTLDQALRMEQITRGAIKPADWGHQQ
jgi:predicted transcriptional regulator